MSGTKKLLVSDVVLDSSAVLAFLKGEPGGDLVSRSLQSAAISTINLCEVVSKLSEGGMRESAVNDTIDNLGLNVIPFDEEQAYQTGLLRNSTRAHGISMGDRACLSLAKMLGVPALTADKSWAELSVGAKIRVIR